MGMSWMLRKGLDEGGERVSSTITMKPTRTVSDNGVLIYSVSPIEKLTPSCVKTIVIPAVNHSTLTFVVILVFIYLFYVTVQIIPLLSDFCRSV